MMMIIFINFKGKDIRDYNRVEDIFEIKETNMKKCNQKN
jgi:hypothetical protein